MSDVGRGLASLPRRSLWSDRPSASRADVSEEGIMRRTHLRRAFAAVATAIACLVVTATPTAATAHDGDITGGEVVFTKPGVTEVLDLPQTACSTTAALDLDVTGTAVTVTALSMKSTSFFSLYPPSSFLSIFTRSTSGLTSGTLTGTTLTTMRVPVEVSVYSSYDFTCTPTGTSVCKIAFLLQLSGTLTGTTVSSTYSLVGSSIGTVIANPTCGAGPSYIIGTTAFVTTAITGHLTT
jgi:hypothetical protein